jgi:hypothetical protein
VVVEQELDTDRIASGSRAVGESLAAGGEEGERDERACPCEVHRTTLEHVLCPRACALFVSLRRRRAPSWRSHAGAAAFLSHRFANRATVIEVIARLGLTVQ